MSGCLVALFVFLLVTALWLGMCAIMGWVGSWLALQFGYHVTWFVCAVAIWLISAIIRGGTYTYTAATK